MDLRNSYSCSVHGIVLDVVPVRIAIGQDKIPYLVQMFQCGICGRWATWMPICRSVAEHRRGELVTRERSKQPLSTWN